MAENGERAGFEGSIAGQKVSFITKDVIPVLLLLAGLVGGYLVWLQMDKRFDLFQAHHMKVFELLLKAEDKSRDDLAQIHKALTVLQWNIRHPDDEQVPFGLNGPLPSQKPSP